MTSDRAPHWEERLDPSRPHPLWGEHRARYRFASPSVDDRIALDVATGSGYGAGMLLDAGAAIVLGLDLSSFAACLARTSYGRPRRAFFARADAAGLPVPTQSFDVVTSFETIEHVSDPPAVVAEFKRVLVPGGKLFISSPNGARFPGGHSGNPYHNIEFTSDGLGQLLQPHFEHVEILGQRLMRTRPGVLDYAPRAEPPDARPEPLGPLRSVRRRAFAALPLVAKDLVWRLRYGQPYYPTAEDFEFVSHDPHLYPTLVAVCRRA